MRVGFERERVEQGEQPAKLRPEDIAKMSHPERIKLLADDAKKGAWSDNAKVVFDQIFKDARANMPGASAENILSELQVRTVREINKEQMRRNGENHLVTLARANGRRGDEITDSNYYVQLHGGKINEAETVRAVREGRETPSNLRVGKIDWAAETKAYEEKKKSLIDKIKKDTLGDTFSAAGKQACKDLFDLVSTKPGGTTITDTKNDLQAISKDVNTDLKATGSKNFVDLVAAATPGSADVEFYMLLSKDKASQQANLQAIQDGQAKDTYVSLGQMDINANGNALHLSDFKRGSRLLAESTAGAWSETSQETWRRTFNDIIEKVGNDPTKVRDELRRYTDKINGYLDVKKPGHSLQVQPKFDLDTGDMNFFVQLNIKRGDVIINRGSNEKAVLDKKDTDTSVKAGSIKLKDRKAAAEPGRDAA